MIILVTLVDNISLTFIGSVVLALPVHLKQIINKYKIQKINQTYVNLDQGFLALKKFVPVSSSNYESMF